MTTLYFTGTGNSLAVARAIGGTLVSIPQAINCGQNEFSDDAICIVFPVYSLNMPKIIRRFLARVRLNAPYVSMVCTYGCMCFGAVQRARRWAELHGLRVDHADAILMLDNFLPFFDIRRQEAGLEKKNIPQQIARVVEDIHARKTTPSGGSLLRRAISALAAGAYSILPDDIICRQYTVTSACVHCGLCARVCPVGNVLTSAGARFGKHCEGCMACIHACPHNAIQMRCQRSTARWHHPDISVADIVAANKTDNSL